MSGLRVGGIHDRFPERGPSDDDPTFVPPWEWTAHEWRETVWPWM